MKSIVTALFGAILSVACILAFALPAQKAHAQYEEDIPNEFIFQVMLPPRWFISEAVFAYEKDGKYYLPIGEFSRDLEFFIEMETDNLYASGFAGSEENTYTIDGARNELTFGSQRETLSEDSILVTDYLATDDLYVQMEVLNKIWPVEMSLELSTLTINIEAEQDLPFMLRKKREEKLAKFTERQAMRDAREKPLPRRPNPYSWFGKPVVDYQGTFTYDDEEDDLTSSNVFNGTVQVAKMLAEFGATFTQKKDWELDRPENIRLKMSRKSSGDEYLLPGVRSVEFGDVTLRQRDLISNTESGRGAVISNDNRDRFNEFDTITIEGTGPPGWDIELYNNEELIEFGIVPDNGLYFFEDVTLNYGNNQIKLVFFGPQGQTREEIRSYTAGGNMLPPGEMTYAAGFLDADRDFILLDNDPRTTPRGVVKTGSLSYGVNRWLTVFGNYTDVPDNDKDRAYITTGAAASTPIGLFELEGYEEIAGGNAVSLDYITSFLGIRTNLNVARFNDFESEDAGFGSTKKTFETSAQFNKRLTSLPLPLGLRLNITHTERESGATVTAVDTAQTISRSGLRLSHNTTSRYLDFAHETSSGGFTTTLREGPWQLRGSFNYDIYPLFELSSMTSDLRYYFTDKLQTAFGLGHNFKTSEYNGNFQIGYDFDSVLASFESKYDRGEGWDFILRASTSLNPYTPDGSYTLTSGQKRQASPINAHIYLDKNLDGEFNGDDEPIENARLRVGYGSSRTETNEDGKLITNASTGKLANFYVDKSSLVDPYYQPSSEGFSAVPNPASTIKASFPVIETGAIEGTVFRDDNDRTVAGLTLELINQDGEKILENVTAFDGYYAFEFVPPGTYNIRAEESHDVDLLENISTVTPEELFVYGNDLYVHIPPELAVSGAESDPQDIYGPNQPVPAGDVYGPFLENAEPAAGTQTAQALGPYLEDIAPTAGDAQQTVLPAADQETDMDAETDNNPQSSAPPPTPAPPVEEFGNSVNEARLKSHNGAVRLVLESNQALDYEVFAGETENEVLLYLNETFWSAPQTQETEIAGLKYTTEKADDGTMLIITAQQPIAIKRTMALQGENGPDTRLVVDVN